MLGTRRSSLTAAVTEFALAGLVAVTVVGVLEAVLLTRSVRTQAIDNARKTTEVIAQGVVQPILTDGVAAGDPMGLAAFDRAVQDRVLNRDLVRVKLWTDRGRIAPVSDPGDRGLAVSGPPGGGNAGAR